jgi:hypothetical protein
VQVQCPLLVGVELDGPSIAGLHTDSRGGVSLFGFIVFVIFEFLYLAFCFNSIRYILEP